MMSDKKIKVSHYLEAGQEPQQIELENGGYNLEFIDPYGRVDGILASECGCFEGGSDNRGNDYSIGF